MVYASPHTTVEMLQWYRDNFGSEYNLRPPSSASLDRIQVFGEKGNHPLTVALYLHTHKPVGYSQFGELKPIPKGTRSYITVDIAYSR